jgi:hypothetical protein
LAGLLGRARSTIWKVLQRHGLSRRPRGQRQTFRRFEWAQPGALLHMDTKRLERFDKPGHWATGTRSEKLRSRGAGHVYVHCVVARSQPARLRGMPWRGHRRADADVGIGRTMPTA